MRLLLDECVPRPLLRDLSTHDAHHVVDQGWSAKRNGELLKLMIVAGFDGFLTVDQSLPFQQNIRASGIGVVLVIARTNRVKELPAGERRAGRGGVSIELAARGSAASR